MKVIIVSNGEPKDILELIKNKGHIYTDKKLAEIAKKEYGIEIDDIKIRNIRARYGIKKLPPALRPLFGGKAYKHPGNGNNYNYNNILMACKKIIKHFYEKRRKEIEKGDIFFICPTKQIGLSRGIARDTMTYLKKKNIASHRSKNTGNRVIWEVDMWKLKEEMKKLEENGK